MVPQVFYAVMKNGRPAGSALAVNVPLSLDVLAAVSSRSTVFSLCFVTRGNTKNIVRFVWGCTCAVMVFRSQVKFDGQTAVVSFKLHSNSFGLPIFVDFHSL